MVSVCRRPTGRVPAPVTAESACKMAPLSPTLAAVAVPDADRSARLERVLALVALIAISGWVAYAGGLYSYDDAFITYRMSANLANTSRSNS